MHTASLRTPLSSSRDATDLRAFRLNDVLQPPGACTHVQNNPNTFFSSRAVAIFFQLSASATSLLRDARHSLVSSPSPSVANGHVNKKCLILGEFKAFFLARKLPKTLEGQDFNKRASEIGKVSYKNLKFDYFSLKKIVKNEFSAKNTLKG